MESRKNFEDQKEKIINTCIGISKLLSSDEHKGFFEKYCFSEYQTLLEKQTDLINKEYKMAFASAQSGGKTSVINAFVLEYPLLPSCMITTTCVPTILRYGKDIKIEISVNSLKENKYCEERKITIHCDDKYISNELFALLSSFFVCSYEALRLDNVAWFAKKPRGTYKSLGIDDVQLSQKDSRHIAMLLASALCTYLGQNEEEENLPEKKRQARELQMKILSKLGLSEEDKNYQVTVYWDSPILKEGIVIYDLPGLDAHNDSLNGYESHENITKRVLENEAQSMFYLMDGRITKEGHEAFSYFLNSEALKSLSSKTQRIIPVINKIDIDFESFPVSREEAKLFLKKNNINVESIHGISARAYSDLVFSKNGIVPIRNTYTASKYLDFFEGGEDEAVINIIKKQIEKQNEKYKSFDFISFFHKLSEKLSLINVTEYMNALYVFLSKVYSVIENKAHIYSSAGKIINETDLALVAFLDEIVSKKSAKLLEEVNKEIEDSLNAVEKKFNFGNVFDSFLKSLKSEMESFRKSQKDLAYSFKSNMWGDIVLSQKNGTKPKEENIKLWNSFKSRIKNVKFSNSFSYITKEFIDLITLIDNESSEIDGEALKKYEMHLTDAISSVDKYVESETSSMNRLISEENEEKYRNELKEIFNKRTLFLHSLSDCLKGYINMCLQEMINNIKFGCSSEALKENLVNKASRAEESLIKELCSMMYKKAEGLETTGFFKTSTDLIQESQLYDFINFSISITPSDEAALKSALNPDILVKIYVQTAIKSKKAALTSPVISLSDKTHMLISSLEESESINKSEFEKTFEIAKSIINYSDDIKEAGICLVDFENSENVLSSLFSKLFDNYISFYNPREECEE